MSDSDCLANNTVVDLYTDLAANPDKDFGWDKGLANAINHHYRKEWLDAVPDSVWQYCAAVGNPFQLGEFKKADVVLDLGCGAGVDLCVASLLVGKEGRVSGVDLTPAMVELARHNAVRAGLNNISVYQTSIEKLPFDDASFNIVISNGAINLSESKEDVFREAFRVLSSGGHLYFADMIKDGNHQADTCCNAESWADCVAGTLKTDDLIQLIRAAGFVDVKRVSLTHYKTSVSTIGATFRASKV
ncbi:MAG: methyltransferase domain-containing protein [Gammaproteobacteria bacterium]|nr:methyltransferase domain-containing protein [Gammaproteobacteria bacterium]MCW8911220.1 methyltransferase domain-containing protein [Gammaproteobacteria bacterium]